MTHLVLVVVVVKLGWLEVVVVTVLVVELSVWL